MPISPHGTQERPIDEYAPRPAWAGLRVNRASNRLNCRNDLSLQRDNDLVFSMRKSEDLTRSRSMSVETKFRTEKQPGSSSSITPALYDQLFELLLRFRLRFSLGFRFGLWLGLNLRFNGFLQFCSPFLSLALCFRPLLASDSLYLKNIG